ncbi:hypothetical protein FCR2A7T_15320 [Flavobacterium cauense R2A-7]|uniref:Carboxypeptidase-like protein n=1 Tax=Flavobacterium cauense R2A-7 TaxID=1341154 RepID=V6S059_9FLAO|nr:hypothetical protein [Flavobacterium cauense]ESU20121.1 hypothetical protein FCR2A7T_15320 [Flavobacterium cauense R2A-7]KGO83924.1 hypothetical protein Q762_01365 [Flavobacterium cauense R2A-7]TWI14739.1 hypothetical protein IP98_00713 [Flavobacterium cauense R2A-7]
MFKKFFLFIFCCLSAQSYAQERYFVVKDSITKEALPYTNINFLNGYGVFSDENGKVILDNDVPNQVKITHIGYSDKLVLLDALKGNADVFLKPSTEILGELKVAVSRNDAKKRKEYVVKPSMHDNSNEMYWSSLGQQFAFYIPNERKNSVLKSVAIPLIVKDLYQGIADQSFEDNPYGTMMKIEFMSNVGNQPGKKIYDYDKVFVIYSAKVNGKVEVKFEETIVLPENGFFAVMTILGKTNPKGEYVPEMPYGVREINGEKKKFVKIILPNYPLVEDSENQLTLFRHVFNESEKWYRIERPMVYKKDKKYPLYNIGIGYTISSSE